jgi:hypothetical protein
MILAALYFAGSPPVRGAFAALAGLTKFAPLALAPLLATHNLRERDGWLSISAFRSRAFVLFLLAFAAVAALVSIPAFSNDSLHTIYERTILYQSNLGSPFSVWGLYGGLHGLQLAVQLAAVALALALAAAPRRDDLVGLAAACAAVIIAVQLGIDHWFYLYIPWFFGLVMIALLGAHPPARFGEPTDSSLDPTWARAYSAQPAWPEPARADPTWAGASTPARWSPPSAALSSGSALP